MEIFNWEADFPASTADDTAATGSGAARGTRASRPVRPRRRLLLTAHVVVAVGVLGADVVLLALGISGLGGADPTTVYPAIDLIASSVIVPLALLALATGLALALGSPWGLARHWWVTIKLSVTTVLAALAILMLTPTADRAADAAVALAATPTGQGDHLRLVLIPAVATATLIMNVALAIYKPFGRIGGDSRGPSAMR
ncbi:DUF2269 domain-containing protein [Micromonospora sp. SL1-18]|uniref:DUF2269 domain-containing protein n=1 Tax=Micromonospora sp. SL1-18 TaxID=3399128 RepID=UPI003A4E08A3